VGGRKYTGNRERKNVPIRVWELIKNQPFSLQEREKEPPPWLKEKNETNKGGGSKNLIPLTGVGRQGIP